jgi:hypothetical protein
MQGPATLHAIYITVIIMIFTTLECMPLTHFVKIIFDCHHYGRDGRTKKRKGVK